mgnify:CR=1 FL=1
MVVLAVLAKLALLGLVVELVNFSTVRPDLGWKLEVLRLVVVGLVNVGLFGFLAVLGALYLWARTARTLPDLKGWHLEAPASEFQADQATADYHLSDYLKQEEDVFQELGNLMEKSWVGQEDGVYNRFEPASPCNPENTGLGLWNRTRVLKADQPIGGVLLLHGLGDSPYSLRALGQRLQAEGYTVIWLRLPGHGTNPRALAEVTRKDWMAAVRVAMKGLRDLVPEDRPLVMAGYSNGGALSLHYTLEALANPELPPVQALLLFSPMIGVNPLAKMTRLYHLVGLFSRSEKIKWSRIQAEIDPFKYGSWPMNAGVQAWGLTQEVERQLEKLERSGAVDQMPPVFALQSAVDSTVVVSKLITALFQRLSSSASELVLFDVNRRESLSNLVNFSFEGGVLPLLHHPHDFKLTLVGNSKANPERLALKVFHHGEVSEIPLDQSWPPGMVSLSHIAVPFPSDDPVYGEPALSGSIALGSMMIKAEPSALMIPCSTFVRSRVNPFYSWSENRMMGWLRTHTASAGSGLRRREKKPSRGGRER